MKVKRLKKVNKRINFYINNFGFREPIQILVDGTFGFAALKNKINIEEQLKNYLQIDIRMLTTPCMIIETDKLGHKHFHVSKLLKNIQLNKCGHEKNPLSGSDCIKSIVKNNRYIIATQDRFLQDWIRNQIGIPLIYLHNIVPNLEDPSTATRKFIERKSKKALKVSTFEGEQLQQIKKKEGLVEEKQDFKPKHKRKGGPNPLSCKKKKVQNQAVPRGIKDKIIDKKKRKRIQLPKHVKEECKKRQKQ